MQSLGLIVSLLATVVVSTFGAPVPTNEELLSKLITAATAVDRLNLLNDTDFVFDFFHPQPAAVSSSGEDGTVVLAKRDTFPALVGSGLAMAVGMVGPCGLNTPHTHPRSAEFNLAVNGTFQVGMLEENGARLVMNTLNPGQATLFPRGAIHFEQNLGCEPVLFVAAFADEDPGVSSLTNFFDVPAAVAEASLDISSTAFQKIAGEIPKNIVFGVEECLTRCGLKVSATSI